MEAELVALATNCIEKSHQSASDHPESKHPTAGHPESKHQTAVQTESKYQTAGHPESKHQIVVPTESKQQNASHPDSKHQTASHPASKHQTVSQEGVLTQGTEVPAPEATAAAAAELPSVEVDECGVFAAPAGFADLVASACYERLAQLPRRARPAAGHWTPLAGVLLSQPPHSQPRVVALATGSKCLGGVQRCSAGGVVSDSHAEVVARRAFQRYLMHQIRCLLHGRSSWCVERTEGGCIRLKPGIRVHFFGSQTPCGDCSIFARCGGEDCGEEAGAPAAKRARLSSAATAADDVYRTGAKPAPGETADPLRPGAEYHVTGVLRTKPGRGPPTLSMSCSDKLAKWLRVGVQGALLSCFLSRPIVFSSVVIGHGPFSESAMRRALLERPALPQPPLLLQTQQPFQFARAAVAKSLAAGEPVPSPCSVVWSAGCDRELQVLTEGIRQGVTKKHRGTPAARAAICRREMMQEFIGLAEDVPEELLPAPLRHVGDALAGLTYAELKNLSKWYATRWNV